MSLTGQSTWSSMNLIYSFKVSGRALNPFSHILSGRLSHAERDSYTGLASLYSERLAGISNILFPLTLYATQTFIDSNPLNTSNFVRAISVKPFTLTACLTWTRSSHPTLLGLPVVVPYSPPFLLALLLCFHAFQMGEGSLLRDLDMPSQHQ